jgi:hypothetical protein
MKKVRVFKIDTNYYGGGGCGCCYRDCCSDEIKHSIVHSTSEWIEISNPDYQLLVESARRLGYIVVCDTDTIEEKTVNSTELVQTLVDTQKKLIKQSEQAEKKRKAEEAKRAAKREATKIERLRKQLEKLEGKSE